MIMDYHCKCGASFLTIEALKQHWEDPERGAPPHYRTNIDGTDYFTDRPWSKN